MKIIKHDSDDELLLDLFFPNIIKGADGKELSDEMLLEKLRRIDGEGSGVDADMVDGRHASAFLLKDTSLTDRVFVGGRDGEAVDGGSFQDFKNALTSKIQVEME